MSKILFIHLMAIGAWIGCVAVEAVSELASKSLPAETSYIAKLHWRIDQFVEIPILFVVLITGGMMLHTAPEQTIITLKILFGTLAVLFNFICSYFVYRRYRCQVAGDLAGYRQADKRHEFVGYFIVISMLCALILGGSYITH